MQPGRKERRGYVSLFGRDRPVRAITLEILAIPDFLTVAGICSQASCEIARF
jgi:hypothetical protein